MPKEYVGVLPKTPMKKDAPKAPPPPPPKPLPPPPPPKPPAPKPVPKLGGVPVKRKIPILPIVGVIFILVVAIGGYAMVQSVKKPAKTPVVVTTPQPPPEPEVSPTPEPEPPPPPEPTPPVLEPIRPGIDTDSDGLTDVEELSVFHSDPHNPDTDSDTYIDGNEVFHGYDPARKAPANLWQSPLFRRVEKINFGTSIMLSQGWDMVEDGAGVAHIVLTDGAEITITKFPPAHEVIEEKTFLQKQYPDISFTDYFIRNLFPAYRSADGRTIVVSNPGGAEGREISSGPLLVVFEYKLGTSQTIEYLRTFEAIVETFQLSSS